LVLAEDALDEAESDYDRVSGLSEDNIARALGRVNLTSAREARDAALRTLNWYTGHPTEVEQALLDGELAKAEARVKDLERKWEKVKDGPEPELVELAQARLVNAQAALSAAETALAETELIASISGEVASLELKVGEQIPPGQIAAVIGNFSNWEVKTDNLTEIERPKVSGGQKVLVTFDALPGVELQGEVMQIGPLFELIRGDVTYAVTIKLLETDPRLQWGMTSVVTFLD
jgi:HlyD family secretion protein